MPLATTAVVTPHFTAGELGVDVAEADGAVVANATRTAVYLERVREILGVPLRITSGYRAPAHNARVGGATTSDHLTALAADVVPVGITQFDAYHKLQDAASEKKLPPWDQIIYYPIEGHIHIGLGYQLRREVRVKLAEGAVFLTAERVALLRGYV